jgi:hypothetical protein
MKSSSHICWRRGNKIRPRWLAGLAARFHGCERLDLTNQPMPMHVRADCKPSDATAVMHTLEALSLPSPATTRAVEVTAFACRRWKRQCPRRTSRYELRRVTP